MCVTSTKGGLKAAEPRTAQCRQTLIDYFAWNHMKPINYHKLRLYTSNDATSFVTADFPALQLQTLAAVRASSWWPSGLANNQHQSAPSKTHILILQLHGIEQFLWLVCLLPICYMECFSSSPWFVDREKCLYSNWPRLLHVVPWHSMSLLIGNPIGPLCDPVAACTQ